MDGGRPETAESWAVYLKVGRISCQACESLARASIARAWNIGASCQLGLRTRRLFIDSDWKDHRLPTRSGRIL